MNQASPIPAAAPEDFGAGALPAAIWLRSAAFFIAADRETGAMDPSAERICGWLRRFDSWYKATVGIDRTERLHLLYHRDVTLLGEQFLAHVSEITCIAQTAGQLGIGFSLTVPLDEAIAGEARMDEIIACAGISTLAVSVERDMHIADSDAVARILRAIVAGKEHIAFIGSYDAIRRLGLLDIQGVDGTQITVYPKDAATDVLPPIPETPAAACFARLRVYADSDGSLYPCLGLVGVPGASLGSIDEDMADTVFGGRPYPMGVDRLARKGPVLTHPAPSERFSGLPWVCERHRRELLADAQEPGASGGL